MEISNTVVHTFTNLMYVKCHSYFFDIVDFKKILYFLEYF